MSSLARISRASRTSFALPSSSGPKAATTLLACPFPSLQALILVGRKAGSDNMHNLSALLSGAMLQIDDFCR